MEINALAFAIFIQFGLGMFFIGKLRTQVDSLLDFKKRTIEKETDGIRIEITIAEIQRDIKHILSKFPN